MAAEQLVWRENAAPQRFLIRRTTLGRRPDDHEDALGLGFHPRLQVDPVSHR